MGYSRCRLLEALHVIGEDNKYRNAIAAEKILRTQYREGFHLRRAGAIPNNPIHVWRDNDTSDDDYDPTAKRRKRKSQRDNGYEEREEPKKGKRKRKVVNVRPTESNQDDDPSPFKKLKTDKNHLGLSGQCSNHAFITFKLNSEQGRKILLRKLREHSDTHVNIYFIKEEQLLNANPSPWRLARGSLRDIDRSASEIVRHFEAIALEKKGNEGSEEVEPDGPRTLRSGKVLAEPFTKKRKKDLSDLESDAENPGHDTGNVKRKRTETFEQRLCSSKQITPSKTPEQPLKEVRTWSMHLDKYPKDAIAIDSSSSDSDKNLTQGLSLQSTSRHKSTPVTKAPSHSPAHTSPFGLTESQISTLTTSFSHPINLKSTIAANCTFHSDYRHPILGHGPTTGQYLIYSNTPSQLIEIDSGHRSKNVPPDEMCISCAFSYMQKIRCPRHTFKPLPLSSGATEALSDNGRPYVQDLFTVVRRGHPNRNTKALAETCNLCPAPAAYRCSAPQTQDKLLRPCRLPNETTDAAQARVERTLGQRSRSSTSGGGHSISALSPSPGPPSSQNQPPLQIQPPMHGCGLLLCATCRTLVERRCDGNMQENRGMILKVVKSQPLGARADAEFLWKEGLVWKGYNVDKQ